MTDGNMNGVLLNLILSTLYKKVSVPSDFHGRAEAVKTMMSNDVSGLVQSLTDFQVGAANVNWYIRTGNPTLDSIMSQWLDTVNSGFNGKVPSGINALATEYYKERWKGASFPVLKILEWNEIQGFLVPTKMAYVEGGLIYSGSDKKENDFVDLGETPYYLGRDKKAENILDKGCIISKPFGRWFDEYPEIYLIRNGVYFNWAMLKGLKDKQSEVLDQILPYLMLIQKGSEQLAINKNVNYDDEKLKKVVGQMEELITRMNDAHLDGQKRSKTPIRATQFDEEIKHVIPDMKTILDIQLTAGFEKGILAGQGFIDVIDTASSSRRESVMNPKPFIQETENGINGFAQNLNEVVLLIKKQNEGRKKYTNLNMKVRHSRPAIFMDKEFRDFLLSLYNRGKLSQKTLIEVAGQQYYDDEVEQRKLEAKEGNEYFMFPPVTQNMETQGQNDYLGSKGFDPERDVKVPQEKTGPDAKMKYTKASVFIEGLEGSPYRNIADLPQAVKDNLPTLKAKRQWLGAFNGAYHFYLGKFGDKKKAETMAFKTAWSQVKK